MNYDSRKAFWILLAIVAFNILCGIGGVALLDPDEPVYAETAKEMIRFHDYLSPRIYHEFGMINRRFSTGFSWAA